MTFTSAVDYCPVGTLQIFPNVTSTPEGTATDAEWVNGSLVFAIAKDVLQNTVVALTVGSSAGISIPLEGVRWNSSKPSIETNAAAGPVTPQPFTRTDSVGSFAATPSITYDSPRAGLVGSILITFTPMMEIRQGEVVRIRMTGFTAHPFALNASGSSALSISPAGGFEKVSWSNETLSLTAGVTGIARKQAVAVTMHPDSAAALALPTRGIRFGMRIFDIQADSYDGRVLTTMIPVSQAVGSMVPGSARMGFEQYTAGLVTPFSVSFAAWMSISSQDVISIFLPGLFWS